VNVIVTRPIGLPICNLIKYRISDGNGGHDVATPKHATALDEPQAFHQYFCDTQNIL
jgi:hypothetical protein